MKLKKKMYFKFFNTFLCSAEIAQSVYGLAGRGVGVLVPVEALLVVQTDFGVHPASYTMGA
jgi:hypothetical protein